MADRISFISFLSFHDPFPDSRTFGYFRERMSNTGKDKMVWAEVANVPKTNQFLKDAMVSTKNMRGFTSSPT
jgi:hypothetical protein